MRRSLLLLGLMMCCGITVTFGENRYGGDAFNAEPATTWQPNRFLEITADDAARWRPNHFLKPKAQVNLPPAKPASDGSGPRYNGPGPRYVTVGPRVGRSAVRESDGGTVVRHSASMPGLGNTRPIGLNQHTTSVPVLGNTRPVGLDLHSASMPVSRNTRPVGLDLLKGRPGRYPWKLGIVTTIFWVGEFPTARNPVPNRQSAWDKHWSANYGGYDNPNPWARRHYVPANFVPRQNPFYVALPYNDVEGHHTKREAGWVIPWFRETFVRDGQTILKDRWLAIRHGNRICYAQWEDCGPFRTDHWRYVFGPERPRPNLNQGAGLDVSPAVRDYLGLANKDVCDWKFVEFAEVPSGPWMFYGGNHRVALLSR
jgi:hypothetical protein